MALMNFLAKLSAHSFFKKKPIILAYHSVSDGSTPISVSIEQFRWQMQYLKDGGYKTIDLRDYIEILNGKKGFLNKAFLITFDDGYEDVYQNALPILKQFGFSAVMSVNPFYVGKKADFASLDIDKKRNICNLEELNDLSKNGVAIVNHGFSHKNFVQLNEEQMVFEYEEGKKWINNNIDSNKFPEIFVFPKTSSNKKVVSVLESAGAKIIFNRRIGVYPDRSQRYFKWSLNPFFRWLRENKKFILSVLALVLLKTILGIMLLNDIPDVGLPKDYFIPAGGDDISYVRSAQHILAGNLFSDREFMGYPFFVAAVMAITGQYTTPGIAFPLIASNIFLFSLGVVVLTMLIIKKFWNKNSYAVFGGLVVTVLPYIWFYFMKDFVLITADGGIDRIGMSRSLQLFGLTMHSDWLSAFLVCLGILLFLNKYFSWSGFILGLSFLTRAQNILFLAFLPLPALFYGRFKEFVKFAVGGLIGGSLQIAQNIAITGSPFIFAAYSALYNPSMAVNGPNPYEFLRLPGLIIEKAPFLIPLFLIFILVLILSLRYFYGDKEKFYLILIYGFITPALLFMTGPTIRNPRYFLPFIPVLMIFLISGYKTFFLREKSYNS